MANCKTLFFAVVLYLIGMAFAAPRPHIGMINNADVQDVGVVYPLPNYGGDATFLLIYKGEPRCMPLHDPNVISLKVCIEGVECAFFRTTDCGAISHESPAFSVGHGDLEQLPSVLVTKYHSYMCYPTGFSHIMNDATVKLETAPHDPSKDLKPGMA